MDRRGAGLTIDCPGCNEPVRVPTPPDAVPETYKDLTEYADMEDLQQSLLSSRKKVDALTAQIAETAKKHEDFEAQRDKNAATINKLRSEFGHIQDALDNIYKFLQE
jgi:septal ring factor EnvC (AmiA/AmiB activator)